jgi:hypothetical protein
MILGHGDIAGVLKDREDRLYFASGVSNSQETSDFEYEREVNLLMDQDKWRHIVYFSSLCVFYTDTRYAQHKRMMEKLIKKYFGHFTIIRIGNITWGKNPHTLINYMKEHKDAEIKDVYRYIISKEEFLHWIDLIPEWSCEMNITGRMMKVRDIVNEYVYEEKI